MPARHDPTRRDSADADPWCEATALDGPISASPIAPHILEQLEHIAAATSANQDNASDDDNDDDDCWQEPTCIDPSLANAPAAPECDAVQVSTAGPSDIFGPDAAYEGADNLQKIDPADPFGSAAIPDAHEAMRRELLGEGFEKSAEQVLEDALDAALGADPFGLDDDGLDTSAPPAHAQRTSSPRGSVPPHLVDAEPTSAAAPDTAPPSAALAAELVTTPPTEQRVTEAPAKPARAPSRVEATPFETDTPPPRATGDLDIFQDFGRFMLVEKIGGSREAEVWRAIESKKDGTTAACVIKKMLPAEGPAHRIRAARFHAEARLGVQLAHHNLTRLLDWGERDGTAYVVREYLEGVNLDELVERAGDDGLDLKAILGLGGCISNVLSYAHGGRTRSGKTINLFHGAISPSSILIAADGTPKLTELSITALGGRKLNALTEARAARPGYESPEQLDGKYAHSASDVFALGMVLVELIGRRPLGGDSSFADEETEQTVRLWCTLRQNLPADLKPLLLAMTARDLDKRPTAQQARRRLEAMLCSCAPGYDLQAGLRSYLAADESLPVSGPPSVEVDLELSLDEANRPSPAELEAIRNLAKPVSAVPAPVAPPRVHTLPPQIPTAIFSAASAGISLEELHAAAEALRLRPPPASAAVPDLAPLPDSVPVAPPFVNAAADLLAPQPSSIPKQATPLARVQLVTREATMAPTQVVRGAPAASIQTAPQIPAPVAPTAPFGPPQVQPPAPVMPAAPAHDPRPIDQIMVDLALGGVGAPMATDLHAGAAQPQVPTTAADRAALAGITSSVASPAFFTGATAATPLPRPGPTTPWWVYAVGALLVTVVGMMFVNLG